MWPASTITTATLRVRTGNLQGRRHTHASRTAHQANDQKATEGDNASHSTLLTSAVKSIYFSPTTLSAHPTSRRPDKSSPRCELLLKQTADLHLLLSPLAPDTTHLQQASFYDHHPFTFNGFAILLPSRRISIDTFRSSLLARPVCPILSGCHQTRIPRGRSTPVSSALPSIRPSHL